MKKYYLINNKTKQFYRCSIDGIHHYTNDPILALPFDGRSVAYVYAYVRDMEREVQVISWETAGSFWKGSFPAIAFPTHETTTS